MLKGTIGRIRDVRVGPDGVGPGSPGDGTSGPDGGLLRDGAPVAGRHADALVARIAALHSYALPCITVWPIDKLLKLYL